MASGKVPEQVIFVDKAEKEIFIKVPRGIQSFRIGLPPGLKDGTVLDIEGFNVGNINLRLRVTIVD